MSAIQDGEKVKFKAQLTGPSTVFKVDDGSDDRFVIWGKASVEVVDKEGDKITADALKDALPQLLRRKRLSLKHSDQLVGDILDGFDTDEEVTVQIDGKEYTRSEFPTDVLELEDEEPALFVAGEVWDDTRQAKETREKIEDGEIDSYSISGEAISSATKVKDGDVYDEITELDLSAVTLCEEGMNQKAKFGTVVKMGSDDPTPAQGQASSPRVAVVKSSRNHENMSNDNSEKSEGEGEGEDLLTREDLRGEFKNAAQEALKESDFATVDQVESIVEEKMEKEDGEDEESGPSNVSDEAGEAEDEAPEEKAEEADEPEVPEETEKNSDAREAANELADEYGVRAAEILSTLDSLSAGGAEGGEEGVEDKSPEDEAPEPEDEPELEVPDEESGDEEIPEEPEPEDEPPEQIEDSDSYSIDELQDLLPDDLYESIQDHLGDGEAGSAVPEESGDEIEMEEKDDDEGGEQAEKAIGEHDLGGDVEKMDDAEYLTVTASGPVPTVDEDEDLMKSFEHEDTEVETDEANSAMDAFYKSIGESPEA